MIRCKCCSSRDRLVVHHFAYKKYGADMDRTIILCENCHNFLHRFIKGCDKDIEIVTNNFLKAKNWWSKK
jgi:hypothetical protein